MKIRNINLLLTGFLLLNALSAQPQELVSITSLLNDTAFVDKLPIPLAAMSVNIEETGKVIEDVEESLGLSPEQITKIDSILIDIDNNLTEFQNRITKEFLDVSSTILLDKSISDIKQIDDRVNGYRETAQAEILNKEKDKNKIVRLLTIWTVTYKAERSTDLSETVKARIKTLIDTLNVKDNRIDTYLNDLLELELKLNKYHTDFESIIKKVEEARSKASRNLWLPDSDPIWMIYTSKQDTVKVEKKLEKAFKQQKDEALEYYNLYKGNIHFVIFIILLVLIFFYILRYKILKEQIEDPEQEDNAVLRLFKRPFAPGLLVGIYLSFIILPQKPFIIDEMIYFAGLIPFTVVLINLILGKNRLLIIYLSFILALAVFSELGFNIEIFSRTFMLIITILSLVLLFVILNKEWKNLDDRPLLRKSYRILSKTAFAVLIICLIGNIIGNYTLTSILLYGVLSTGFLAISMYLIYLINIGLFEALFESKWGQSYRVIKQHKQKILRKITRITTFVLTIVFIIGTLEGFNIMGPIYKWIEEFLITPYTIGSFSFSLIDILLFFVILLITSWISQFIEFLLLEQVFFKTKKRKNLSASISSLVTFGIISIGFFVAALASGFPLDKLALLISAFGVGIGFGLQNIFNNLVSGIILVFERPLEVGDTIEVGHLMGVVKKIGIRASTIRTFDGSEVIVPNGNLVSNELINWTLSDSQRRLIIKVGVAYGTNPNEVIKILLNVARKNKELLEDPEPYVLFKEFGDSALGFELRCFTESGDWLMILSDLHVDVNNAINKAGMVIPFPQHDLHIKSLEPNIVKSVKSNSRTK